MYEGNLAQKTLPEQKDVQVLLNNLAEQNDRYCKIVFALEDAGHRLKNTSVPETENNVRELRSGNGWLSDLSEQADKFRVMNNRLNELLDKINGII